MSTPFRRSKPVARLSHEEQVRQGKVVNAARAAFGDTDSIRSFLNTHHEGLQGRPIDLAVESDDGLAAVQALILTQSPPGLGSA